MVRIHLEAPQSKERRKFQMIDEFDFIEEQESCYEEEQLNYYRKFRYHSYIQEEGENE